MAQSPQVIELLTDASGSMIHGEALSAAGSSIYPGDLLEMLAAGTVQEHSTAADNAQKMFALTNLATAGTIDDAYAVGETVRYGIGHSGQKIYARLAAAATAVTKGMALESAGDGTVRKITTDAATDDTQRDAIVGYADESVDNSGGGSTVRIRIVLA